MAYLVKPRVKTLHFSFSKGIRLLPIRSLHQLSFPRDQDGTREAQNGHKCKSSL